ncbi:MAG: hypothetical protein RJA81_2371 [Planctomycetota bacterium]|jgi:uncharacterized Zn finger protein
MGWWHEFEPYVSVAEKKAKAKKEVARRRAKGQKIQPVEINGRKITTTFWGKAWCENLESYSDFSNRLSRGRSYVLHGSVIHLEISKGSIQALVSGSSTYQVQIEISPVAKKNWLEIKKRSAGQIGSLIELLHGKISKSVMELVTNCETGLFPKPSEIKMSCNCPDYADMCKHLAAVMYGIGNRLDIAPELLFQLRDVDHQELVENAIPDPVINDVGDGPVLADDDLGAIFGIEIDLSSPPPQPLIPSKKVRKHAATSGRSKAPISKIAKTAGKPVAKKASSGKSAKISKTALIEKTSKTQVRASRSIEKPVKTRQAKPNKAVDTLTVKAKKTGVGEAKPSKIKVSSDASHLTERQLKSSPEKHSQVRVTTAKAVKKTKKAASLQSQLDHDETQPRKRKPSSTSSISRPTVDSKVAKKPARSKATKK